MRIPIYDASAPIACTIGADEVPGRVELIERLHRNLERLERTADGLILSFPADAAIEADLRQLAIDEKRCCQFWGFEVLTDRGLALRWDGPPSAADLLDRLARLLTSDEPITELDGLF